MKLPDAFPVWAAVAAVVITLALSYLQRWFLRPWLAMRRLRAQGVPGYPFRPVLGNFPELIRFEAARESDPAVAAKSRAVPIFFEGTKEFGKVWMWSFGYMPRVVVADPALVRAVMVSKNDAFPKPEFARVIRILGKGLVSSNGELWAHQRKLINPAFHMTELRRLYSNMVECVVEAADQWQKLAEGADGKPLQMDKQLCALTLKVICTTAFGARFTGEDKETLALLQKSFEEYCRTLEDSFRYTFMFSFYPYVPSANNRVMWKSEAFLQKTMKGIISARVKENAAKKQGHGAQNGSDADRVDLLQMLINSTEGFHAKGSESEATQNGGLKGQLDREAQTAMSAQQLMDESLTFLLAGHETTAGLMTWTMLLLSQHPEWQDKARAEVETFRKGQGPNWAPSFEEVGEMKLLGCILQETLRLFPPAPAPSRRCLRDTALSESLTVPADCEVVVPIEVLHYSKELWGEDAHEFNPQRFAQGTTNASLQAGAFLPFTVGPRVCIGQNFALIEGKLILAVLLSRFTWRVADSYVHHPKTILTVKPKYGMPVVLTPLP